MTSLQRCTPSSSPSILEYIVNLPLHGAPCETLGDNGKEIFVELGAWPKIEECPDILLSDKRKALEMTSPYEMRRHLIWLTS